VVLLLCPVVHGCVDVNGGAVELSWKLRAATGSTRTFLNCNLTLEPTGASTQVSEIQLDWEVDGVRGFKKWPCENDHGVTGFELPEGDALLNVRPVCRSGEVADDKTFSAPAPEQRKVIVGTTVNLGGVELLLEVSSCDFQTCICQ
jgi:hypothetical protein